MTDALDRFRRDYRPVLLRYLAERDETGRQAAYELGRQALLSATGLLDVVRVHHDLLLELLDSVDDTEAARDVTRVTADLLLELIACFEISQRGYLETQAPRSRRPSG